MFGLTLLPQPFGDLKGAAQAACSIRFYFAICQVQFLLCERPVSDRQFAPMYNPAAP